MTSLEAVLKLLYSLSECGPAALKALGEGALPTLVNTLHATGRPPTLSYLLLSHPLPRRTFFIDV